MKSLGFISFLLVFSFLNGLSFAQTKFAKNSVETQRIERLISLCKLWGKVKYFHPSLAYRTDIDWDAALVKTIPKVNDAKTSAEFADALQSMLDVLGDSATRIMRENSAEKSSNPKEKKFEYRFTEDKVLIIIVGNYFDLFSAENQKKLNGLPNEVPKARAIVFDLRSAEATGSYGKYQLTSSFGFIERLISTTPLITSAERSRLYRGFEGLTLFASGQYKSGFYTQNGRRIMPTSDSKDIPSVFLVNENSHLLNSTTALQAAGKALIVFDGNISKNSAAKTETIELGENFSAQIRVTEPILEDGTSGDLLADVTPILSQTGGDTPFEVALDLARNFKPSTIVRRKLSSVPLPIRERSYSEMKYPSLEYRLLAAFRIWNIFNYFFPYKHLLERDWEDVLREFIPKLEQSKDALEYSLTIAEMVTHIHDSHGFVNGAVLNQHFGISFPPIRVRLIENSLIVTALINEAIARQTGIEVGDEILKVDGEDAKTRFVRYGKYISASTPQSRTDKASQAFMNGADKSIATLTIRNRVNQIKEIKLPRKLEDYTTLYHRERSSEIIKLLPNNIGYVDLDRLQPDKVDEMFEKFKNTRGIIFDMRGYPNGVFGIIPQRLTDKKDIPAALIETPIIGQFPMATSSELLFQNLSPKNPDNWIYKGKTVMLIDERTMSQAEHTGLFLRAANGTKFIGSPTAGADGELTSFSVPGGITVGFTGQSVKLPDGKQLQRIGLIPDILVKPTIKGIKEGRDEVLEKAIKFLK